MSLDHPFSTTEIGNVSIGSIFLQCLVATGDDRQDLTLNNFVILAWGKNTTMLPCSVSHMWALDNFKSLKYFKIFK